MSGQAHVVVAIPARNEQDSIRGCLRSVQRAIHHAREIGLVDRARVEVVAHRCTDATAHRATQVLRPAGLGRVLVDDQTVAIGAVRDGAVRRGLAATEGPRRHIWVLSTDADTVVGPDWVAHILTMAHEHDACAVVGLADLDRWHGGDLGRAAYEALLTSKLRDAAGQHQHDHVYGANLAVRADAYLAVGGFPHLPHGEDQGLVDTLATTGYRIMRIRGIAVTTSGRLHGRAPDGLADCLRTLDSGSASAGPLLPAITASGGE